MGVTIPRVYRGYVSDLVRELNRDPVSLAGSLSLLGRVSLRVLGYAEVARVRVVTPEGVEGEERIYLAKCPRCGALYADYPHGYTRYLVCPRCGYRVYI